MTCIPCQRIRRVIGLKRRVGVDGVNPDRGLFADGLTIPQKILHVGGAFIVFAIALWVLWVLGMTFAAFAEWASRLVVRPTG